MKRNLDLSRRLLMQVAEAQFGDVAANPWRKFVGNGASSDEVKYNVVLLLDADLLRPECIKLDAQDSNGGLAPKYLPDALSLKGNEYLEAIQDETVWVKAKESAKAAGGFAFDVVISTAKMIVQQHVEKSLTAAFNG